MQHGTLSSEVRLEARRCLGIAKALGIRLAKEIDLHPSDWQPNLDYINRYLGYNLALVRIMTAQRDFEREARRRIEKLSTEEIDQRTKGLMKRQLDGIINESIRGSAARVTVDKHTGKKSVPVREGT